MPEAVEWLSCMLKKVIHYDGVILSVAVKREKVSLPNIETELRGCIFRCLSAGFNPVDVPSPILADLHEQAAATTDAQKQFRLGTYLRNLL